MYDSILYETDDPVAVIRLNRPDALNAWTGNMDGELRDAMERAEADPAVVGIVLTGAGRGFCAGADMNLLQNLSSSDPDEAGDGAGPAEPQPGLGDFDGRFPWIMNIRKPVIGAINGAVAGMGYPLALCCDVRFGTEKSLFVTAFAHRGLIAEWGLSWLLPQLVGPSVALDLLYSSRRVYGPEALRIGLLNHLVDEGELLDAATGYVRDLAAHSSPASLAVMKRQVYEHYHQGLGAAEHEAQRLMVESFHRPDFAEGVRSFTEKRPPAFPRVGEA